MPFDPIKPETTYSELRKLRDLLLDRSQWPLGFRWNFAQCRSCAIGLWMKTHHNYFLGEMLGRLGLYEDDVIELFGSGPAKRRSLPMYAVMPEMIVEDIDQWLIEGKLTEEIKHERQTVITL